MKRLNQFFKGVWCLAVLGILWTSGCKKDSNPGAALPPSATVTDIDGNVYHTVKIGSQTWMKENLAVVRYRNGNPIPEIKADESWITTNSGAYCNYANDTSFVKVYGRLYNWYAATDLRKLCPTGWHVPADTEWKQLEMFLGLTRELANGHGYRGTDEGGKLKDTSGFWYPPNTGATNSSGFTALPGGYRTYGATSVNGIGTWWSASQNIYNEAIFRSLTYDEPMIGRFFFSSDKSMGLSIRCIHD